MLVSPFASTMRSAETQGKGNAPIDVTTAVAPKVTSSQFFAFNASHRVHVTRFAQSDSDAHAGARPVLDAHTISIVGFEDDVLGEEADALEEDEDEVEDAASARPASTAPTPVVARTKARATALPTYPVPPNTTTRPVVDCMLFHLHPSGNQEASCDVRRQLFVVGFVGPDKPTTQRGAAATAAAAADMTSSTCATNRRSVSITVAFTPTLRRHFQAALENESTVVGTTTTTHLLEGVRRALIDKDEDVRVDYALAFDVCEALRTKGLSRDAYVSKSVTASDVDFAVVQERRSLTESEVREKREHEALMRRVRRELEEREYDAMTRDVARTASNRRHIRNDESGLSKSSDARVYGLAVHVLSVMFAFVCAGYAAGGAVDQRLGTVSARGLLAAVGAALGLLVETGLLILRDSRASSSS